MKKFKSIILIIMLAILSVSTACSKDTQNNSEPARTFVGVAIYQNAKTNNNYSKVKNNTNYINKLISTDEDRILYDENPEYLFYIYNPTGITSEINKDNFISNTTNLITLENNILEFTIERIYEDTDIIFFSVYKNNKGKYYLEMIQEKTNITQESFTFDFDFSHELFNKIKINLKQNMNINEKY